MSVTEVRPAFRQRLRAVTRQMWALHMVRGIARTALAAIVLIAAAAAVDFVFELPILARITMFAFGLAVVLLLGIRWVVRPARTWSQHRVVVLLEGLFPGLGQRMRTVLEHGAKPADQLVRAGVEPELFAALEEETTEKSKPLPFRTALPVRPVLFAVSAAAICLVVVGLSADQFPEWQTALRRATLSSDRYTTLSAVPSADLVDEGADVDIRTTVTGRARPAVSLHVREVGEADWREEALDAVDGAYTARLPHLRSTTEFFVSAGPEATPTQQIVVRHPLKIVATRVEVKSPEYAGVIPAAHSTGSFSAVQGSSARLVFELDRPPAAAALVLKDRAKPGAPARRVEMTIQDRQISAELPLTADLEYAIDARDAADVSIVPNRYLVRVTADQPPTVWFDLPAEGTEVHTLAEVLIRARASDDFGISKIGVVFQVNNEDERTLIVHDAKQPFQRTGRAEQLLMLEQFMLTEKDCVGYYAFAEDNRPGTPQRVTTDLRFIDIRPFRRFYQLVDPPDGEGGGGQRDLIFLDEVIKRQRFNLNQTMRLETRSKVRLDVAQVEQVAAFENKLATQAHELSDFLIEQGVDGAALLAQAEETMLSAVDSIQGAKFAIAIGQERDALRYLMEARNTVRQGLLKSSRQVQARARAFDRLQRQKLRREQDKGDTLTALAAELERLAAAEDEVARLLAVASKDMARPAGKNAGGLAPPMPDKDGSTKPGPSASEPNKSDPNKPDPGNSGQDKSSAEKSADGSVRPANPASETADPLQERQDDIAAGATAVDKIAATVKELTALARTRISASATAANAAADAFGQKDCAAARKEVDRARELLHLAAQQVAALAAKEAAQQLAAARDIANEVANQTSPQPKPGMRADEAMSGLGNAAEKAKTLKDLLEQIEGSSAESDAEAARQAGAALKSEDLAAAIKRLEQPGAGTDRNERQDLAERFAALGQKLDRAYRELVAPRLEELARLEQEAGELQRRLNAAEDDAARQRVLQQTAEFVERLDAARLGDVAGAELRESLKAGLGDRGNAQFARALAVARQKLIEKLKEFVAGDRFKTTGEAVPPEYKELVDRYLRTLSAGSAK